MPTNDMVVTASRRSGEGNQNVEIDDRDKSDSHSSQKVARMKGQRGGEVDVTVERRRGERGYGVLRNFALPVLERGQTRTRSTQHESVLPPPRFAVSARPFCFLWVRARMQAHQGPT